MGLKDDLRASLVDGEVDNVVDFSVERLSRRVVPNADVLAADLLRSILAEIEDGRHGDPQRLKCSVTLVKQYNDNFEETESFRAKLNLPEELMYLQITAQDLLARYSVHDAPKK